MQTVRDRPIAWPLPPFHVLTEAGGADGPEGCQVTLRDGRIASGTLVRFGSPQDSLDLLTDGTRGRQTLPLELVKCVRLPRRLQLRREETPLKARAKELFQPSERQSYSLEFAGKEVVEGETVGHVNAAQGLFLYVPADDGGIVRHFYPRSALRSFQIGRPIGNLLLEENIVRPADIDTAVAKQHERRSQRIGEYLTQARVVSRDQLSLAIKHQEGKPVLRLGEALRQLDLITEEQLQAALARHQEDRSSPLGRILVEMGYLNESALKDVLARKLGIPFVGLVSFNFDHDAVDSLKKADALRNRAIPLCRHDGALVVAFEDPLDAQALDAVRFLTQTPVIPAMASREEIQAAIKEQYSGRARSVPAIDPFSSDYAFHLEVDADADKLAARLKTEDQALGLVDEKAESPEEGVSRLVIKMVLDACAGGATDIHVEARPGDRSTRIRFRKDGSLVEYLDVPASSRELLFARIKTMARLDVTERRKPQDGRLDFRAYGPAEVEFRVATIPTAHGLEDLVMRAVQPSRLLSLDALGFAPEVLEQLHELMQRPSGLLLVCGPTGAGKSATVHALLETVNTPARKIWTAEDPIEFGHEGLRQVEVNPKGGWTMAAAVRSFLRADADVIMTSEMRDAETAKAAIEAALSGRLVLSMLFSRSAAEGLVRLLDLGMNPFNVSDSLQAMLAQRLARGLCPHCRQPYEPEAAELAELAREYCEGTPAQPAATLQRWREEAGEGGLRLHRAAGCGKCHGTGYLGRVGVHELLLLTPALRRLLQTRAPVGEIAGAALAGGVRTLRQDGIAKVLRGLTDAASVRAVCP